MAVMVSLKAVPAVGVPGLLSEKPLAVVSADTVKLPEVPVMVGGPLWVAVSDVVWASNNLIDAVPTPAVKFTVVG